jgi:hypothetical protein
MDEVGGLTVARLLEIERGEVPPSTGRLAEQLAPGVENAKRFAASVEPAAAATEIVRKMEPGMRACKALAPAIEKFKASPIARQANEIFRKVEPVARVAAEMARKNEPGIRIYKAATPAQQRRMWNMTGIEVAALARAGKLARAEKGRLRAQPRGALRGSPRHSVRAGVRRRARAPTSREDPESPSSGLGAPSSGGRRR